LAIEGRDIGAFFGWKACKFRLAAVREVFPFSGDRVVNAVLGVFAPIVEDKPNLGILAPIHQAGVKKGLD
jgi:hypothetical protein